MTGHVLTKKVAKILYYGFHEIKLGLLYPYPFCKNLIIRPYRGKACSGSFNFFRGLP